MTVRPAFLVVLGLTLAAAAFNGIMVALMALRLDALLPAGFNQMGHFTELHHRTHDLTFGSLFVPSVLGLLAQLRRPRSNIAGMLTALVPGAALLAVLLLTVAIGGNARVLQPPWVMVMTGALLATALHPAGHDFFRAFRRSRVSAAVLALVGVAAFALVSFAWSNVGLQASVSDDHAAAGHYGFMAAAGLTILGLGVLASLRPQGWRLTAWNAGGLALLLGAVSLRYGEAASSLALPWAFGAIVWGALFIIVAELECCRQPGRVDLVEPAERVV